jgi:hypothetical protein
MTGDRIARELWWTNQFYSVNISSTEVLHAHISPGVWIIGVWVATGQRLNITPSMWLLYRSDQKIKRKCICYRLWYPEWNSVVQSMLAWRIQSILVKGLRYAGFWHNCNCYWLLLQGGIIQSMPCTMAIFWSIMHPHLSYRHSWFIHQSSLANTSKDT